MNEPNTSNSAEQDRITALRESIRQAFPAERYVGRITPNDDNIDDPELDEDKDLCEGLKGATWTEVPEQLLLHLPSGYGLLTNEAFTAFLPAWLMYSLRDVETENEVRDFLGYSFGHTMRQFRVLNSAQQLTVRSILVEFTQRGTSEFVRKHMVEAVALIDRRRY